MRALIKLLLAVAPMSAMAQSGNNVPLVMNAENTFDNYKKPKLPKVEDLPVIKELPNPLQGVKNYKDWGYPDCRRDRKRADTDPTLRDPLPKDRPSALCCNDWHQRHLTSSPAV